MKFDPDVQHRRSIRLQRYDYSSAGAYFVTICTQNRECLFGEMEDGAMRLNDAGKVAEQCWQEIPGHFPQVELDEFVVMPNHVHGILVIGESGVAAGKRPAGTSRTIGSVVRGFKIGVTKWMRQAHPIHAVWQRNYWEHIIREEVELEQIREYIRNNPVRWELDQLYPGCRGE
ncbi:MAG: transposase [Desulfuromonadales bacterium]|nr:transposase [Desulfuromonadales bacterium]